ncbi:hypothetical protein [Methylomicrobium lacus]|uniref:hypothetical protein n=1 Tax=Methylomicrobium lacus TaxID=136992 RepID=UPI0035A81D1F
MAIAETLLVLTAYIWLAFHCERQWWLLLSALAAPILLLRSEKSKEQGLALAKQYKEYWGNTTGREKTLIFMLVTPVTLFITYDLAGDWLYGYEGLAFCWRAAELGATVFVFTVVFAVAVTAAIRGLVDDAVFVLMAAVVAITVSGISVSVGAGLIAGFSVSLIAGLSAVLAAGLVAIAITVAAMGGIASWIEKATQYFLYSILIPFMALGIWTRSLCIRIYSTLHHPIAGLLCMPYNWRENLLMVDFTHLPELLPDAGRVDDIFTVKGLWSKLKSAENVGLRVAWFVIILLWYFPALLWRWSLKATVWLWLPLALLFQPPLDGLPADQVRDHAASRVYGLGRLQIWIVMLVLIWLAISYLPGLKPWVDAALDEKLQKPLTQLLTLPPPKPGLRLVALLLYCGLSLAVENQRGCLKNMHKQVLDEEQTFHEQPHDRKDLFVHRTRRLERWYTSQVVAFIVFGYSVAIWLGHKYYPAGTEKLISAWLLSYL